MYGWHDPDVPAGFQDADLETSEILGQQAKRCNRKAKPEVEWIELSPGGSDAAGVLAPDVCQTATVKTVDGDYYTLKIAPDATEADALQLWHESALSTWMLI